MKLSQTARRLLAAVCCCLAVPLFADGPADNIPGNVRRIPGPGIEVPADQREALAAKLEQLAAAIGQLAKKNDAQVKLLLPDVQIYHRAVLDALTYQEFFDAKELPVALNLLDEGLNRAQQLATGQATWTMAAGLVVRGYVSKIDGSVQPYGLVIPANYTPGSGKWRVDVWFHGRGEKLSEVNFLNDRSRNKGQFTPADTMVLHPYGRYCNAAKFAGEIDALEALESVKQRYRVDDERISVRGFSMGGASAWQFAVHYPSRWAAANPGAGFSETPDFLKVFQKESLQPTWWERKLWHMYDCTDWAVNLYHCPTVAYSGEEDSQKQAADVMEVALEKEGLDLVHIIGPKTKHAYEPKARDEVDRRMAQIVSLGRQRTPRNINFVTYTLRYNECAWIKVDGLTEHWEQGRIQARIGGHNNIVLTTKGLSAFTVNFGPGEAPFDVGGPIKLEIDGQSVAGPQLRSDRSWQFSVHQADGTWQAGPATEKLRKQHGLQGPIDDAFLDGFVFVTPTGKGNSDKVNAWVHSELDRAIEHWRRHFRGQPRVKKDTEITDADIADFNLVLWGDASSNQVLGRLANQLPLRVDGKDLVFGKRTVSAENHAPILIYPNPLNPQKYVVVNSSFTFRDYAYLNNARQVSMLPDWAIIDVTTPPNAVWPGKVVQAGFFDEAWQLKPEGEPESQPAK